MGKKGSTAKSKARKKFPALWLLAVLGLTLISFSPALKNGFIQWDDNIYVTDNPLIASLSWSNIATLFTTSHYGVYVPLTMISYSLEYALFGKNPTAYHATNVALHLVNAGLVFWLFFLIFQGNAAPAFIAAALFSIHPLRVESVAWISERKDLLCAVFFFLSLLSHWRYRMTKDRRFYRRSLVLFFGSLLAKPMALTLPFVLLLMDYFASGRLGRKAIIEKIPFFALVVLFSVIAVLVNEPGAVPSAASAGILTAGVRKAAVALYSIAFYVLKILFPFKLAAVYPYTEKIGSLQPSLLYLSPAVFALMAAVAVLSLKHSKKLFVGIVFFVLTLIPILQLISLPGNTIVADRYTYIPGFGAAYIGGVCLTWKLWKKVKPAKILLPAVFTAIILVFSVSTFGRCRVWKDDLTLWNDVLEKYPNVAVAHDKLGLIHAANGNLGSAIEEYSRAIAIDDSYVGAYNNRAIAYKRLKRYDLAIADYTKIIGLAPSYADAYYNLGNLYHEIGRDESAVELYNRALRVSPKSAKVYNNRGNSYIALDELKKALADFSKALEINPAFDLSLINRGLVLIQLGRYDESITDLNKAARLKPSLPPIYLARGLAYAGKGDYPRALAEFDTAIRLKPDYEEAITERTRVLSLIKNNTTAGEEIEL